MNVVSVDDVNIFYAEHGSGQPVLVLHGMGVDHREVEACFEPIFEQFVGFHRIYPDLPGMGRSLAPETVRSADDVLMALIGFADRVRGEEGCLIVGHSAGAYYAQAMAARRPELVRGLVFVCPLLPNMRGVPERRIVATADGIGDAGFRSYFVVQTPQMLERYERFVAPATALVDEAALSRIGEQWEFNSNTGGVYAGPTLVVAGRLDFTVGYASAVDLVDSYPHATVAVLDDAGHALPHEQPDLLQALITEWLTRVQRPTDSLA